MDVGVDAETGWPHEWSDAHLAGCNFSREGSWVQRMLRRVPMLKQAYLLHLAFKGVVLNVAD